MSSQYDDLRTAIAAALDTVTSLTTYERWPESCDASLPAAAPVIARGEFDQALNGGTVLYVDVILLAALASVGYATGQALVDNYLEESGPYSIKAALELDPTLDGVVDSIAVQYWDDYRMDYKLKPTGAEYWGVRFRCEVFL